MKNLKNKFLNNIVFYRAPLYWGSFFNNKKILSYIFILIVINMLSLSCDTDGGGVGQECIYENCCPVNFTENNDDPNDELICLPEQFYFINNQQSSGYIFNEVNNISGNKIGINDDYWVGAFIGDVCVGATHWILSECNDDICSITIFASMGDIPTFVIYDATENIYYDATPSSVEPWQYLGTPIINELNATSISEELN